MGMNGELELLPTAARYEYGTRNTSDHAGWARAIEFWEDIGWEQVWEAVEEYVQYLARALTANVDRVVLRTPLGAQHAAGILSFYIPGHSGSAICQFLSSYKTGVLVSPFEEEWYDNGVRKSLSYSEHGIKIKGVVWDQLQNLVEVYVLDESDTMHSLAG